MKYSRVFLEAIGYELAPVVISSAELEAQLRPLYEALHVPAGQLEALTGIIERRWWEPDYPLSEGALAAARKALAAAGVEPRQLGVVIYAGVCREHFEPATACRVAAGLGVGPHTAVHDVSNACLGVLDGIVDVANRIELKQCRAGLVVSCETAREINETVIDQLLRAKSMELFKFSLATLTGGSGAVAVLVTDGSFSAGEGHRLLGGATRAAPEHHGLCRWGLEGPRAALTQFTSTDAAAVLKYGVELGRQTWEVFLDRLGWGRDQVDKVICHQVGAGHREAILEALGIPLEKYFSTFAYLGNTGTVALPLTAALAAERDFLQPGDRVGFLGIGSGLNCLMLGLQW
jgi:3-oxoacyl-[acyl-carrier-protein] synthase-3